MIDLDEFKTRARVPKNKVIVRFGCSSIYCEGWAEIFNDEPWGLRPWELPVEVSGPLNQE